MTVLILSDDFTCVAHDISDALKQQGIQTQIAHSSEAALDLLDNNTSGIIYSDGVNDMSPEDFVRAVRDYSDAPLILATQKDSSPSQIARLFDLGADRVLTDEDIDFIPAHLNAIYRHMLPPEQPSASGDLRLNESKGKIYWRDVPLRLSPNEYKILALMIRNTEDVVTRAQINETLYGDETDMPLGNSVDVFISRIRNAIKAASGGASYLQSRRGLGFVLTEKPFEKSPSKTPQPAP